MKKIAPLGLAAALAVAGCSSDQASNRAAAPAPGSPTAAASTPPTSAPPAAPSAGSPSPTRSSPSPAGSSADEGPVKIGPGEYVSYESGLEVRVPKLTTFRISDTGAGGQPGQRGLVATVSIKNGTSERFDLGSVIVNARAGSEGEQAESVYDSERGVGGGFEGTLAPGRTATARYGFAVDPEDLDQIQIEVRPDYDRDPALFEGSAQAGQRNRPAGAVAGGADWPGTPLSVELRDESRSDVRLMQQQLSDLGFPVTPDGHYGPDTEKAVKEFQKSRREEADGDVGKDTWSALTRSP